MIIENSDALKVWLTSCLGRMCDADPAALAKYVLALVKKEKSEIELREFCLDQLEVFLLKDTKHFVDLLFETLKTKSYLYKTDSNVPAANTEAVNNITVNNSKKLNSSEGREKTDSEKDSVKPENVPKSKSSHFSSSRKHTKMSGRVSRENRDRNRSRSHSSSSQSSRSSSRERLKDKSDNSNYKHKKELLKPEERRRDLLHDGPNYSHIPYHLNNTKGSNRCKDYDEKGYCMQGDLCIYDHGADPVVLENVHGLNFGVTLGAHVPTNISNENSIVPAPLDTTKSPLPPPPPTSPPPLPPPPPPLPPLPVTVGPYIPEPYNPEAPAMNITSPADIPSYWMQPNMHIPSLHHSRSQPLSGMSNSSNILPQHNSKTRSRELIGVPTVEVRENNKNISLKNISHSPIKKRKGFDYSRLGPKPKRMNYAESICRTLELKCVPKHLNTIALLNSHFSKFGNITNIEVFYNGDPEAALIQFQTHAEAALAHDSTDAVLNNRFIQVFWHNKEEKHNKIEKKELPHLKEVVTNHSEVNNVEKLRLSTSSRIFNAEKNTDKLPERSVVYSRGNICRTVYNPSILKKADTSTTSSVSVAAPKEDKKVNKKMELFKKKQDFLESQLKYQKVILDKLSSTKNEKDKGKLKQVLDELGGKIKESQQDLKDLIKQCNSPKTPAICTKTEAEKMLLDAELDLYNTLNKCDSDAQQDNTAELLLLKVNELKQKAKALGLKESAHEIGLKAKRRHMPFSKSINSLKIDNRPKTLFISGTCEKDVKKYFLSQLSDIEKIEERKTGFVVTFKTRKAAETAFSGNRLGSENVSVSWFLENQHSPLEDVKESNVPKVKDDNVNYPDGDEDEDEEEDSEARSWRR